MLWIVLGLMLVFISLYKLYFLLKPLLLVSHQLIEEGVVKDVNTYTEEVEMLRLELLELNDAYYNEIQRLENRMSQLETITESNKRIKRETSYREKHEVVKVNENPKLPDKDWADMEQKVNHPLFDRVRGLFKLGYKEQDIAKELGIGISEVQLLIKRIKED